MNILELGKSTETPALLPANYMILHTWLIPATSVFSLHELLAKQRPSLSNDQISPFPRLCLRHSLEQIANFSNCPVCLKSCVFKCFSRCGSALGAVAEENAALEDDSNVVYLHLSDIGHGQKMERCAETDNDNRSP